MSGRIHQSQSNTHLKAGHFYGNTLNNFRRPDLILSELQHAGGKRLPLHTHESGFFCLLLDGNYTEYYAKRTIAYKPLTIMWHPPAVTHSDEIGPSGGRFFMVEVQDYWLDRLREYSAVPDTQFDLQGGELVWLALRLYREYKESQNCSPLMIEGIILEMLAIVSRTRSKTEKHAPAWLARVVEMLHEEFRHNLTVNSLGSELGIHPVHLSRVFRQFYGDTIGDYTHKLRVQFACQLLTNSGTNLAEIALASGFSDQSHFTRVFKRVTGMTPKAFRMATAKYPKCGRD